MFIDIIDVVLEWVEKNVKSNLYILELIEIRKVCIGGFFNNGGIVELSGIRIEDDG